MTVNEMMAKLKEIPEDKKDKDVSIMVIIDDAYTDIGIRNVAYFEDTDSITIIPDIVTY